MVTLKCQKCGKEVEELVILEEDVEGVTRFYYVCRQCAVQILEGGEEHERTAKRKSAGAA